MQRSNKIHPSGFTLIEILLVIAILVMLGIITMANLMHVEDNTQVAATTAIGGALSAANATNYISRSINSTRGVAITNCTDVAHALRNTIPNGYAIIPGVVIQNKSISCTLNGPNATSTTFTATGIN